MLFEDDIRYENDQNELLFLNEDDVEYDRWDDDYGYWDDDDEGEDDEYYDDSMDGDWDSGMRDAGWGTDEDYGYYGENDWG